MPGRSGRGGWSPAGPLPAAEADFVRTVNYIPRRASIYGGERNCANRRLRATERQRKLHVFWERRGRRCPVQGVGVVERLLLRNRMMPLDSDPNIRAGSRARSACLTCAAPAALPRSACVRFALACVGQSCPSRGELVFGWQQQLLTRVRPSNGRAGAEVEPRRVIPRLRPAASARNDTRDPPAVAAE